MCQNLGDELIICALAFEDVEPPFRGPKYYISCVRLAFHFRRADVCDSGLLVSCEDSVLFMDQIFRIVKFEHVEAASKATDEK